MPLTKKAFGLLLADLSEVFDCHDLLIAKLYAYELDLSSMNLALSYLSKRKQITTPFLVRGKIFYLEYRKLYPVSSFVQYFYV